MGEELSSLEKSLEMKEIQIRKVTASSTQVEELRQQYERQLRTLENKRTKVEKERQDLAMVGKVASFVKDWSLDLETSKFESHVSRRTAEIGRALPTSIERER